VLAAKHVGQWDSEEKGDLHPQLQGCSEGISDQFAILDGGELP